MKDIIKRVKFLEDFGLLLKGVTETVQNEVKEQKGGFLSMLLGALGASLLGNLLTGPGVNRKGKVIIRAREGVKKSTRQGKRNVRAGYGRPSKNNKADF